MYQLILASLLLLLARRGREWIPSAKVSLSFKRLGEMKV